MNEFTEYRGYVFINTALSSIQKGVQGAHALVELTEKYYYNSDSVSKMLWDWRCVDKTLIFLEAGFHQALLENYLTFSTYCEKLGLPYALFVEDDETMNSMATAFAGIVPSTIYDIDLKEVYAVKAYMTKGFGDTIAMPEDSPEEALCRFLKSFNLAR